MPGGQHYWGRHRAALEAYAWGELCRMAVPELHRGDTPLARLGPWEPAQRYWRGNAPELDVVARSVDGRRLLVGEAKWPAQSRAASRAGPLPGIDTMPGAGDLELISARFVPEASVRTDASTGVHLLDARDVISVLRRPDP